MAAAKGKLQGKGIQKFFDEVRAANPKADTPRMLEELSKANDFHNIDHAWSTKYVADKISKEVNGKPQAAPLLPIRVVSGREATPATPAAECPPQGSALVPSGSIAVAIGQAVAFAETMGGVERAKKILDMVAAFEKEFPKPTEAK